MTNESAMSAILEFVYTGSIQTIATRELAENLVNMADYLFLPNLKSFALRVVGNFEDRECFKLYFNLPFCRIVSIRRTSVQDQTVYP